MGLYPSVGAIFFFWLVCEVIILNYVAKVWREKFTKKKSSNTLHIFFIFLLLFVLALSFTDLSLVFVKDITPTDQKLAYQVVVDFYCTLYVLFESLITVYAAHIYRSTKYFFDGGSSDDRAVFVVQENKKLFYWLSIITMSFTAFYIFYHIFYIGAVNKNLLESVYIHTNFHFYFYICGFLWVVIDFIAAFFAYKFYRVMSINRDLFNEHAL